MVKVRERDALPEVQASEPASKADLVRLARLVQAIPSPDLTAIERRLLAHGDAIDQVAKAVALNPTAATYEFEIKRDAAGRIASVVARPMD